MSYQKRKEGSGLSIGRAINSKWFSMWRDSQI